MVVVIIAPYTMSGIMLKNREAGDKAFYEDTSYFTSFKYESK
jgi:hypothetical protein